MIDSKLHLQTPMAQAILKFFRYLEKDIRDVSAKPGSISAYIFGGSALHIHTKSRGSHDIDAEFMAAKWLTDKDIVIKHQTVLYNDNGKEQVLELDRNFTPMLGPVHEDYQEDAIQIQPWHKDSPLWVYVVTPEDLAISKLNKCSEFLST